MGCFGCQEGWVGFASFLSLDRADSGRFKAAYCTALEGDPIPRLFGDMDVVGASLVEMANGVIAASQ